MGIYLRKKKLFIAMAIILLISSCVLVPEINYAKTAFGLSGMAHVQNVGDQNGTLQNVDGVNTLVLGTRGQSRRVEEITVNFNNGSQYSGGLEYRVHIQNIGWTDWVNAGTPAGSRGKAYRLEGIEMRLTGELAIHYSVRYAVHIQNYGDAQGWMYDGALAGTTGESLRLEEVKVQIVPKNSLSTTPTVAYRVHRQDYGWEKNWATNGKTSGTTGQSKRLEGITITVGNSQYSGGIEYQTHIQNIGWESSWASNGRMSGTSGRSYRLEAIRIRLTGELANHYSVYYRVHAQNVGWMGWACDGDAAGTAGYAYRLEAIQIMLVPKGSHAPGVTLFGITADTGKAYQDKTAPAPEPTTEAHQHNWVTVTDKEAWDEPVYEEEEVMERHWFWPDGTQCDELATCSAKANWCYMHCISCFPNCPEPDPAGRCAITVYNMPVTNTNKVQVGTTHHDAVTHQECSTCGARQ